MTQPKTEQAIMNDRNSLFIEAERNKYQGTEHGLIEQAKQGNLAPLYNFWAEKRKQFMHRAFERSPYAKDLT